MPPAAPRTLRRPPSDLALAIIAGLAAFAVYALTLTPSVAPGDVAELQYLPSRLGIPHPNGFPLYLLLGKLWSLAPLGELAWRMNLLSAVFGALSAAALYLLLRVTALPRASSLAAALMWAFQRTFWGWSVVADRYSLLFFLVIAAFAALLRWRGNGDRRFLWLAALLTGCAWATHVVAPLFALPLAILLLWPGRAADTRGRGVTLVLAAALFVAPILLYAYIPLRGSALWFDSPVDPVWGQPAAVLSGLVHPRYAPGSELFREYFGAGAPGGAARIIPDLIARRNDLRDLFAREFGFLAVAAGVTGLIVATVRNRAWGIALLALLAADIALATHYWQGNVAAYFLPAMLALTVGLAELGGLLQRAAARLPVRWPAALVAGAILLLPLLSLSRNPPAMRDESLALDRYWRTVLALPLEPGAGLLAHWSDLTPLYYFQQAEGLRADAQGLYLPDIDRLAAAVRQGRAVYLSGPLSGWYPDLAARFQLIPWGPLVRLAAPDSSASTLPIEGSAPLSVSFGDTLALESAAFPAETALPGATAPLTLTWRSLAPFSRDMHISLRLRAEGRTVAQQDDRVVTPWFPSPTVGPGLDFWSRHEVRVPLGLPPGEYELAAVVYDLGGPELPPSAGGGEVTLGRLRVGEEAPVRASFSLAPTLGPCIRIEQERPLALEANAGALLDFDLLLALRCRPADGTTLRFALSAEGREYPLTEAGGPVAWRDGGHQRMRAQARVPADAPEGRYELRVEAVEGAGERALARRIGPLPLPFARQQTLGEVRVTTRPFATAAPALASPLDAPFDNGMRLLGYERGAAVRGADPITVTLAWRADRPVPQSYQLFIHLLDANGNIVAQRDAPPGDLPTQAWLPGEVVVATHTLQPAAPLPPGEHRMVAGLYDAGTMQRALVTLPGQSPADHVELGALQVAP